MNFLLRHLRSNVVAYLALIVAMGGTSYAAVNLPKDSVTAKQIKKNAVRSAEVKNGSLRAKDFKKGQLPAGPRGASAVDTPLPAVRVSLSADVSAAEDTFVTIAFDKEIYDQGNMHSAGAPTRLTAPQAGIYRVSATVNWDSDPDGRRFISVAKNGSFSDPVASVVGPSAVGVTTVQNASGEIFLDEGDYVTVRAQQSDSGGSLAIRGSSTPITVVSMSLVSAPE